ncbi:M24 family metallopeptidase [Limosilactobacillus secaliphilus]|uniref:Xaa-Pro dipeptidase n=1 Tax=Limosilactobacillus secaliphilus TaxID=396268 RepID=A0A0R2I1U7_9LACO|nr:aminopeptidase P family protein [Limosilactobacillus secaliphilus]KRN59121.1 Xaa-Pro dipeptidase [Limosilactobacillus secaliphilus]
MTRITRLQKRFPELYIDAFLVTDPLNIYYLSGFHLEAGDGFLLITEENAIIVTDARYAEALAEFDNDEVVATISSDYYGSLSKICQGMDIAVLGFEESMSYALYDLLDDLMLTDLVPFKQLIEQMREIKDINEIEQLTQSARLLDDGYRYVLSIVQPGMTEREVANRLDFWLKERGASAASFPTIVASGINGAKPHATASDRQIQAGELVTLDFGYYLNGYTADMTRTFAMGPVAPELKEMYGLVLAAHDAVIEHAQTGIDGASLDQYGRQIIEEAGLGQRFIHGMGHGIGLAVHEMPMAYGPNSKRLHLQTNEVITVEPGIYVPGLGGVRIEDDLVIGHGPAQQLTQTPTDLVVVD